MVRAAVARASKFAGQKFSKKAKEATCRVLITVALFTLPATALATWLSQDEPFAFIFGAKAPKIREMIMDVPGNSHPILVSAAKADLEDSDLVIGVAAFGEAKAYLRGAFGGRPERHVVHDRFGETQVTVTHCDRTECTRIFSAPAEKNLQDLRCGGWMIEQEMALRVGKVRYAHSSKDIPFADVPYIVTTWGEWRAQHPDSTVYVGPKDFVRPPKAEENPA